MMRKFSGGLLMAAAAGAMLVAPLAATASASVLPTPVTGLHDQPQGWGGDPNWGGYGHGMHPGRPDPGDPWHNDWHCDRHGYWHADQWDRWGWRDPRCRSW